MEPLVRPVVELPPVERQRADVVHDLAAEVVLAVVGDVDLLLDRAHQPLVGLFILAGVRVPDLLLLGVRLDVVHVVPAQAGDRGLVGGDGALHLVLDDVLVFAPHVVQKLAEPLALLLAGDQRVPLQAGLQLVQDHERVDAALIQLGDQRVRDLVLDVAG